MALDFPTSPTNGQTYTHNGITYYWDAALSAWLVQVPTAPVAVGNTISSNGYYTNRATVTGGINFLEGTNITINVDPDPTENKANITVATSATDDVVAAAAFDQANTVWDSANGNYTFSANTVRLIANTAYNTANTTYTYAANTVLLAANSAYANANAAIQTWVDTDRLGFRDRSETTLDYNDTTYTFTLQDAGGGWGYYRQGKLVEISGNKQVVLGSPPADGQWYIYIDANDGTLTASLSDWSLMDDKVPVATVEWRSGATPKYWIADERHSVGMDRAIQYYFHAVEGAKLISAPTLTGYTVDLDTNAAVTFAISASTLLDQDYLHNNSSVGDGNGTSPTNYVVWYRTGASAWTWTYSNVPYKYTPASYIEYDNAGTMTTGQASKYYTTYLLVTGMEGDANYVVVPGRGEYGSLAEARSESIQNFTWDNFEINESVIAYRLIWYTGNSYGSDGRTRLAEEPGVINLSAVTNSSSGAGVDHNTLTNLQGGTVDEYYHLTQAEYEALAPSYDAANTVYTYAANNVMLVANSAWDKANTANLTADTADTQSQAAFDQANTVWNSANGNYTFAANTVRLIANTAYGAANSTYTYAANNVMLVANTAYAKANAANITADIADTQSQAAFNQANTVWNSANGNYTFAANTVRLIANSAYAAGNSNYTFAANTVRLIANTAYDKANSANLLAYAALPQSGGTIDGDLVVSGNVTISGNTTFANTETLLVGDNIIELNADLPHTVAPSEDAGIQINRGSADANVSVLWNEGVDEWQFTNDATTFYAIATNTAVETAQAKGEAAHATANTTYTYAANNVMLVANTAYAKANAANITADIADTQSQAAFDRANSVWDSANSNYTFAANTVRLIANTAYGAGNTNYTYAANTVMRVANSAYAAGNTNYTYAANNVMLAANAAFAQANAANLIPVGNTISSNGYYTNRATRRGINFLEGTNITITVNDDPAINVANVMISGVAQDTTIAEAAFDQANTVWNSANSNYTFAANTVRLIANTAYAKANTNYTYAANNVMIAANSAYAKANTTYTYAANNVMIAANSAYAKANSNYTYAANTVMLAANAAFAQANAANLIPVGNTISSNGYYTNRATRRGINFLESGLITVNVDDDSAINVSNVTITTTATDDTVAAAAFGQANTVWNSANSNYTFAANTVRLIANSAYAAGNSNYTFAANTVRLIANSAYAAQNTTYTYAANNVMRAANSAYAAQNTTYTFAANTVRLIANTAYDKANSNYTYAANNVMLVANTAMGYSNVSMNVGKTTGGTYASASVRRAINFIEGTNITVTIVDDAVLNTANVTLATSATDDTVAVAAFLQANTVWNSANSNYTFAANTVRLIANSAYAAQNTTYTYAANNVMKAANSAYAAQNTTYTYAANNVMNAANSAYAAQNTTYTYAANNVMLAANSAFANSNTVTALIGGQQTIWVAAAGMVPRNDTAASNTWATSGGNSYKTMDFDGSTQQYAEFSIQMPKGWDEGDLVCQFVWNNPSTSASGVVWGISTQALADGDSLNTSVPTPTYVADTCGTGQYSQITNEITITPGGSPGAEELLTFVVTRPTANGSDTYSGLGQLHGVKIHYRINTVTDD